MTHEDINGWIMLIGGIVMFLSIPLTQSLLRERKPPPKNGDRIRLTWLPNPVNNPHSRSCYIGVSGIVEDASEDGSFILNMGGGLLIVSRDYKYTFI